MFVNVPNSSPSHTLIEKTGRYEGREVRSNADKINCMRGCIHFTVNTYSLCTKWFLRSCVMSSCQPFLMPEAEGGPAVGMEPTPLPSLNRLEEGRKTLLY